MFRFQTSAQILEEFNSYTIFIQYFVECISQFIPFVINQNELDLIVVLIQGFAQFNRMSKMFIILLPTLKLSSVISVEAVKTLSCLFQKFSF